MPKVAAYTAKHVEGLPSLRQSSGAIKTKHEIIERWRNRAADAAIMLRDFRDLGCEARQSKQCIEIANSDVR